MLTEILQNGFERIEVVLAVVHKQDVCFGLKALLARFC
jgi:hypothetical protein